MNRIISKMMLVLIVAVALGLSGCGDGGSSDSSTTAAPVLSVTVGSAAVSLLPSVGSSYTVMGSGLDGVAGIELTITYDADTLGTATVTQGDLLAGALFSSNTSTPGSIRIAAISSLPVSGSGPIAAISFASGTGTGGIRSISANMIDSRGITIQ
ncbi:MAG: hypothetical protein A2X82_18310 [Geobacteraceae bacterium GWC2_55_20]|nr:MAG: hypothetical protein A2X82_18310 [Geobacteraceae bacterium GWC2_55_20]OGU25666.1 MAG: hypothetical protein A2X85_08025 [Geobacteraceae bacterium GWF2_54_21]HBA73284.1 hypothetical protein [Geobacter sp.]HCE68110.1 hypothetical protein [Geobacter sp.]